MAFQWDTIKMEFNFWENDDRTFPIRVEKFINKSK